jgi:hypothetical protein
MAETPTRPLKETDGDEEIYEQPNLFAKVNSLYVSESRSLSLNKQGFYAKAVLNSALLEEDSVLASEWQ